MEKLMWPHRSGELFPYRIPVELRPYTDALGFDLASTIFLECGGAQIYLGTKGKGSQYGFLKGLIGDDGYTRLCESGLKVGVVHRIPLANEFLVKFFAASGVPVQDIARRIRMTDVGVRSLLLSPAERLKRKRHRKRAYAAFQAVPELEEDA
ncbi:hypothetical protein ELI03_34645 [Rhizobium leguminosarum]|uniref:Uncharacterized protein n=1 Tax=Rhizobium leguminosarum TaxID=384 RepID=A0A4Q8XRF6_RHILE|nr:hypothetical protein [Rhizobium leguminosarum]TAX26336.1 hypothetical protein ELI06_24600 [Rhizobium leguminosarum]TAX64397.1 hypothetical protein ELI03_34645 [Rhizobium leguminosarum]